MGEKSAVFLLKKSVVIHTKWFLTPIFKSEAVGGRPGPSVAVGEKYRLVGIRLEGIVWI